MREEAMREIPKKTTSVENLQDKPIPGVEISAFFDNDDADLIIRCQVTPSSDAVLYKDFGVHKTKLAQSPVFRDMFDCGTGSMDEAGIPIVQVSESAPAMEMLLRFMYGHTSSLTSAKIFHDDLDASEVMLYDACFKYDLPTAALAAEVLFV